MSISEEKSFLQQLWEKGIVRNLVSYLLGAWAILQFVDWIVTRYHLSSMWTDVILVFFLAMLPSVLLYTYFHNKAKTDTIKRLEKVIIPSNMVLAFGFIFIFFSGKSFGATSNEITVVDEEGETVQRFVPKATFVKRFLFFPTIINSTDQPEDTKRLSIPNLQCYDLEQDNRIYAFSPNEISNAILRKGFALDKDMPFAIQKKLAEEYYTDFFIQSSLTQEEGNYELKYKVLNTVDGKTFFEQAYLGDDLFELIDQFSEALKKAVYHNDAGPQATMVDLPSNNLISSDWEVINDFQIGFGKKNLENKPQEAIQRFQKSIEKDPNCALCYKNLAFTYFSLSESKKGEAAIENALSNSEMLPERMQLDIKYLFYLFTENNEKAIALLEMWRQLYPSDYIPYVQLMNKYRNGLQFDKAIEVGKQAIEAGHSGYMLTRLADIYTDQGNTTEAIKYYKEFEAQYPNRVNETSQLGYIYRKQGELEKAKQHFEKVHLLDPQNHWYIGSIGQIEGDLGNFDKEMDYYKKALKKAKLARDSSQVMQWMEYHYVRLGQIQKSLDLMEKRFEVESQYLTPYQVRGELISPNHFMTQSQINKTEAHYKKCLDYLNLYAPEDEEKRCFLEIVHTVFNPSVDITTVFENCQAIYEDGASQNEKALVQAFFAKNTGNYKEAIKLFSLIEKEAPDIYFQRMLAESYFAEANYEKALEYYKKTLLEHPQYPEVFAEIAYVYQAKGDKEAAKSYLDKALAIWTNPDPEYIPAQKAKAALEAL